MKSLWKFNKFYLVQAAILAVVLFFAAIFFMYGDITNTIDNSNILIRAVTHGKMLNFYELSVQQSATNYAANYNFMIYVIFALWQSPAYFIVQAMHKSYLDCAGAMMWSKMLVILFSAIIAFYIYKIVMLVMDQNRKRALLAVLLYYSSMFVVYPVFICVQIDALSIGFMMFGLYHYLKKDRFLFWLAFLIATPCKMFALLLALPLILAREKNLFKAAVFWVSMAGLLIVEKIMFHASPIYGYALDAQSRDAIDGMLRANLKLGRMITVFFICYMALLLYAYMKKSFEAKHIIYMCFFLWGTFASFSALRSYWIYLVAPFMILAICINDRFMKYTTIVETIGSFGYFCMLATGGSQSFRYDQLLRWLYFPSIARIPAEGQMKYGNLYQFVLDHQWDRYQALFSTIYVFSVLAVLVLTAPKLQDVGEKEKMNRWVLPFRPLFLVIAGAVIIYAYTASTNPVAWDTRNYQSMARHTDLIASEEQNTLEQDLVFPDNRRLDELTLKFKNTFPQRSNMALLYVELWDAESNTRIFQTAVGCNSIENKTDLKVDLKHTVVKAGRRYQIRLYGKEGNAWYRGQASLFPYLTVKEKRSALYPVRINGKTLQRYLYFEIR